MELGIYIILIVLACSYAYFDRQAMRVYNEAVEALKNLRDINERRLAHLKELDKILDDLQKLKEA